jgi:hypothetical protein
VGDGGSLRGHFGQAVGFAQMGDERERPVTWGHRIDVPVCLGTRRERDAHSVLLGLVGAAASEALQPTTKKAALAAPNISRGFIVRSSGYDSNSSREPALL